MEILVLSINTLAPAAPNTRQFNLSVLCLAAMNHFASSPKNCKKCFRPLDAVPKKIRMMRFQFARPVGFCVSHFSQLAVVNGLCIFGKPQRRRTEHWNSRSVCETKNLNHVTQRTSHGLIDKHWLD